MSRSQRIQGLLDTLRANNEADLANTKAICDLVGVTFPDAIPSEPVKVSGRQISQAVEVLKGLNEASALVDAEIFAAATLLGQ